MLLSRNVLLPLFTLISCWSASFTNTLSAAAPCPARAVRSEQYLCIRNFPDLNGAESLRQRMRDADKPLIDLLDAASLPIGSFNVTAWEVRQGQAARNSSTVPLVEFYDLKQDPRCQRNLAATRENQPTIQIMRQIMDAELIRANDPRETVPGYQNQNVEGWPFRVSEQLLRDQPAETDTALQLLKEQLQLVIKVLPRPALGKVRNVPIWLSPPYANARPTGEYHPGADWLRNAGRRPELVRCVEFTNIDIMRQEVRRMPMMVLHELAHAYHDQKLGFDHPAIKTTYDQAAAAGIYAAVQRNNGRTEAAYAISNPREYFAESSEAFFGINDFYPSNRRELADHDPRMHDLLIKLWGVSNVAPVPQNNGQQSQ